MVIPFSNTKLRVPKGFQSLLVGLSTEILRSQPRNIHEFAADYFQKLVERRDQGESVLPDKQTALEDRYYNNPTFHEDYPVNDPDVQNAVTKIQAQFRGHQARQNVEKMKHENKEIVDTDQQELGYGREHSATPKEREHEVLHDPQHQPPSHHVPSTPTEKEKPKEILTIEPDQQFDEEISEKEKEEQERAARSIQARFRGHRDRKSPGQERPTSGSASDRSQHQNTTDDKASLPSTSHHDGKQASDQHAGKSDRDHHGEKHDSEHHGAKHDSDHYKEKHGNDHHGAKHDDRTGTGEHHDTRHPDLHREPTQLSEDFERHTQVPRDSDFQREQRPDLNNAEDDMNDSDLDKAATRIQASFRGYITRKELGAPGSEDQQPPSTSSHAHDEYDHAHHKVLAPSTAGNKEPEGEEDDDKAAVKIQAAYRGYRVRKDLEK